MWILGYNGGDKRPEDEDHFGCSVHDAAAALFHDETLIAAIEEERLNRIKHTNCFPAAAIQRCLDLGGIGLTEVDLITTNTARQYVSMRAAYAVLENISTPIPRTAEDEIAAPFFRNFGVDVRPKIRFCHHHEAHLWSAYLCSGYEECLAVSIDGQGDDYSWLIGTCRDGKITKSRSLSVLQSLGNLYTEVIRLLGYRRFDEYKAMGLAPYGDPEPLKPLFERCYTLLPDGDYCLRPTHEWLMEFSAHGLLDRARRKGQPFEPIHQQIAASLQATLERITLHVLSHEQRTSGHCKLVLAGGVAHNCTLNGVIANSGLFDDVFVQPAAHDAGGAIGAACALLAEHLPDRRPTPLTHVYLGSGLGTPSEIKTRLDTWAPLITFSASSDISRVAARLLSNGAVVGWIQGRSEFGPRALGNRSILADARPAGNKDLINAMVKKREQYRPFAPSVIDTAAAQYFELPVARCDLSFMTFAVRVKEDFRAILQAVTHIDGTARVQTVSRQANPRYWQLLKAFEEYTGLPILLNTSFNNNAEPIIDSIDDGVACFLTTGLNYLVIDDFVIEKQVGEDGTRGILELAMEVPLHRRLLKRGGVDETRNFRPVYEIESSKSSYFGPKTVEISAAMFSLLEASDSRRSIRDTLRTLRIPSSSEAIRLMKKELFELWTERWIRLMPALR
jgi:carbamoyltransferase